MGKAVLISIQPNWCELILSGKKTIEVRKTRPKLETPFKCYIYCTQTTHWNPALVRMYESPNGNIYIGGKHYSEFMTARVIGEFICERIIDWSYIPDPDESADPGSMAYDILTKDGERTCLEYDDIEAYGKGAPLYGWCIIDLVIYDQPKKLSEFHYICGRVDCRGCKYHVGHSCDRTVKHTPQSWGYVEELEE